MSGTNIANMSYMTQNEASNTMEVEQNNEAREDNDLSVYKNIRTEQVSEKVTILCFSMLAKIICIKY